MDLSSRIPPGGVDLCPTIALLSPFCLPRRLQDYGHARCINRLRVECARNVPVRLHLKLV